MKKLVALLIILLLFVFCACAITGENNTQNQDFLRIHIRANSNKTADQNVKYAVKTAVVDYLTPYLAEATTKQEAMYIVASNLPQIAQVADDVLAKNGLSYNSKALMRAEEFPTRSYDGIVLNAGVYDALIVNLGSGEGDNWWCVVYPPLCFVPNQNQGGNTVVFRWKILEIIQNWKNSR